MSDKLSKPSASGRGAGRGLALLQVLKKAPAPVDPIIVSQNEPHGRISPQTSPPFAPQTPLPRNVSPQIQKSPEEIPPTIPPAATVVRPKIQSSADISQQASSASISKQHSESKMSIAPTQISVQSESSGRGSIISRDLCEMSGVGSTTGSASSGSLVKDGSSSSGIMSMGRSSGRASALFALREKSVGRGALVSQFILNAQNMGRTSEISDVKTTTVSSVGSVTSGLSKLELQRSEDEESLVSKPVVMSGSVGNAFAGTSNWLRLILDPRKEVYEYIVFFDPPIDARNVRFKLLSNLQEEIGHTKSFDGVKLWLPSRLDKENTIFKTTNPITNEEVSVRIELKLKTLMSNCVQLYNVLFSRVMRTLKMTKVGHNYYTPGEGFLVPQYKLEIWPGYVTAAHWMEGGLMLCVDTSHKVIRTTTAHEIMAVALTNKPSNFEASIKEAVVGSVVLTKYNNLCYAVDDIAFDQSPKSTFTNSRGEEIAYVDYYKNQYNITIKDLNQPLLVHKLKKKEMKDKDQVKIIFLIPELCKMTGLTDAMKNDFRVMKDVAQHTRLSPTARQQCLIKFVKNVQENSEASKILSDWGLTLDPAPAKLKGRTLPLETIILGKKEVKANDQADFSRDVGRERVLMPVDIRPGHWVVMYTSRDEKSARNFVDMMSQVCRPLGLQLGTPRMVPIERHRADAYVAAIREHHNKELRMAVIIFPSQREDCYNAVKKIACGELGLPTQCIVGKTICNDNKLRSVTVKIALQINCKLGGELWAVKIPMKGLMVCGIDVYHDPSRRGFSVASFVASTNQLLTKWYSNSNFQKPGDEIINTLMMSMRMALQKYHEVNKALPQNIIVFRDGVSDGEIRMVREHEVPQLMSIFRNFEDYSPKLSMVVVQKRINTRVFAALSGKGLDNPPPGSVMDHTITKRDWYDFLLISQHVRQGTVSPTHYIVVFDGVALKVDNMQRLTYKLTYLYYNWPGTIRVPAPCQYAHKLAYLVGQNIRKPVQESLLDKLFFL